MNDVANDMFSSWKLSRADLTFFHSRSIASRKMSLNSINATEFFEATFAVKRFLFDSVNFFEVTNEANLLSVTCGAMFAGILQNTGMSFHVG